MTQQTSYSYVPLLVGVVLLAGLVSSGSILADSPTARSGAGRPAPDRMPQAATTPSELQTATSTGETTTQPDEVERHFGPVTVTVTLNCSYLSVNVQPTTYSYTLALDYRHEGTGQRIPLLAGPFTGSVDDPFGETDLQLVEVQIRVEGIQPMTELAPERCLEP